jgi:type IV secretion system protein VirD4
MVFTPAAPSTRGPGHGPHHGEDIANSGLRREPDLPKHVAIANEATAPPPAKEFDVVVEDTDDSVALQARALSQQLRGVVRQTPLDPDDGLGM